jgi:hypothetical protein
MTKFIELTDYDDEPLMVNVANIIWVRPYEAEEGTMIYVTAQGKNNYPVSLCVKESYSQVSKLIQD